MYQLIKIRQNAESFIIIIIIIILIPLEWLPFCVCQALLDPSPMEKILLEVLLSSLLLEAGLLSTLGQINDALWVRLENLQEYMLQPVGAIRSSADVSF